MDVLPDAQEQEIQQAIREFLQAECTPAAVRAAEKNPARYSTELWDRFTGLGWLGLCLPESLGGQGLGPGYLGLMMEEMGRHIAPLPVYCTMVGALVVERYGSAAQRELLRDVAAGKLVLSFAVQEPSGRWDLDGIQLEARVEGQDIVLNGSKHFVEHFGNSGKCLVACRLRGEPALVLVDTRLPGISTEDLSPMAKDQGSVVRFDGVRVPAASLLGTAGKSGAEAVAALMDYASVFLACQMQGAARKAMEFAVEYVKQRHAFGQPIGAFQAIQHMAADMVNAVDGTELLCREAIWNIEQGLPARVEVAQAKSFANGQCLMVCRCAQQMHGGIGFIAEFDLNLWYHRVASWSLRAGTTREHRARIASSLLAAQGPVRLGMTQHLPAAASAATAAMKENALERA